MLATLTYKQKNELIIASHTPLIKRIDTPLRKKRMTTYFYSLYEKSDPTQHFNPILTLSVCLNVN